MNISVRIGKKSKFGNKKKNAKQRVQYKSFETCFNTLTLK